MQENPLAALTLIDNLGLHASIFTCAVDPPRHDALVTARILHRVIQPDQEDEILWMAAATSPFRNLVIPGKRDTPAVSAVLANGLKVSVQARWTLTEKLANDVKTAVANVFIAAELLDPNATRRSSIGTTLQLPAVRPWERSVVWATVMDILSTWTGDWDDKAEQIMVKYRLFVERLVEMDLPKAIVQPPLLNVSVTQILADGQGKQLKDLLDIPSGPLLSVILAAINVWQFDHPEADGEACKLWVRGMWDGAGRAQWEAVLATANATKVR